MPLPNGDYTVREFAEAAHISYTTALKYIKRCYVKSVRRGGRRVITKDEVQRFLKEGNLYNGSNDNSEDELAKQNVKPPYANDRYYNEED